MVNPPAYSTNYDTWINFIAFLHGTVEQEQEFGNTAVFQARNRIDEADDWHILDGRFYFLISTI